MEDRGDSDSGSDRHSHSNGVGQRLREEEQLASVAQDEDRLKAKLEEQRVRVRARNVGELEVEPREMREDMQAIMGRCAAREQRKTGVLSELAKAGLEPEGAEVLLDRGVLQLRAELARSERGQGPAKARVGGQGGAGPEGGAVGRDHAGEGPAQDRVGGR